MKDFLRLIKYSRQYSHILVISMFSMIIVAVTMVGFTSVIMPLFDEVLVRVEKDSKAVQVDRSGLKQGEETAAAEADPAKQTEGVKFKHNALTIANRLGFDKLFQLEGKNITLVQLPVIIIILFLLQGIFSFLGGYLMSKVGMMVVMNLRIELYQKITSRPLSFFTTYSTGTLISRVMNDIERIKSAVSEKLADILREGFTLVALIIYVLYLDWKLTLITFCSAWIVIVLIAKLGKLLRRVSTVSQEQTADMTTILHETITGIRIVKAFVMEKFEIERFSKAAKTLLDTNLRAVKVVMFTPALMEFIGAVMISVMIYFGGMQIQKGKMTAGFFLTFIFTIYAMYTPIKKLSRVNNVIQEAMSAATRVFYILDMKTEIRESENARPMEDFTDKIVYNDVAFGYRDDKVVESINFEVKKGEVLAIVGSSGAGKSTLINLLPRFYDLSRGSISIDGVDIRDYTLDSLRYNIGMVTQDVILFNDSVANNIAYGTNDIDMDKIKAAAKAANADKFIEELPNGYDTNIGEKGITLSGGQKQRLAIARAIFKNPPILILDEATSALDSESEILVQKAINALMKNRTTLVIAHRLSTVRNADNIIVMSKGHLIETGRHEELVKKKGEYKRLYDLQFHYDKQDGDG
ncbi:MAG: ATP-binding cassette domain-containing protein [Acidobacteria bacterium]|nr:ATP-binding cassette domain-containing protein [Acidobacteriota bacterium]